jgi:hypothetical protein
MEPYKSGFVPDHWKLGKVRDIVGEIVTVSGLFKLQRNLELIYPKTRSIVKNSIVELSITNEKDVKEAGTVNRLLYLGFFEVLIGGQAIVDELVFIKDLLIGKIAGFSDVHEPNHLNLIVESNSNFIKKILNNGPIKVWDKSSSVYDLDIDIGNKVKIKMT